MSDGTNKPKTPWEFPELAAIAVLVSFVSLFASAMIRLWLSGSLYGRGVWPWVQNVGQWVTYSITALLLGGVGVCWWHCARWTSNPPLSSSRTFAITHIRRVRTLSNLLRASTVIAAIGALATLASELFTNEPYLGASFTVRAGATEILDAVSVIVFALVGFVVSGQVTAAATVHLNSVTDDSAVSREAQ